jgi:transcriptional regulator with XRE-family HTH domain
MRSGEQQHNAVDAHIGGKIQLRRNLLKLSQKNLGEHLGVSFQQIQKFEKGSNRVSAAQLFEIAKLLQVDISFFFEGLMPAKKQPGFAESQSRIAALALSDTREGHDLNGAFARIRNRKLRKHIIDLVRAIAESEPK